MGNFRMGAAFLALEHGVPVVPVAHRGTFAAMPRGQNWPSKGRRQLTIRFGEPLWARPDESVREFAPRIKAAVASLLDEDRSTWWESRQRAAAGSTPDPSGPAVAQWRRVWEQSESPVSTEGPASRLRAWRSPR
jgi:1-acyl-sn-glycerol-3-phosphate acyltransferase